jgi:hypothetical protein
MDFMSALRALQEFQSDVERDLSEIKGQEDDDSRNFRRHLECEPAVIYRQTAIQYLQHSDDDNYMAFMRKSQEEVRICSDLKEPTT